jgi:hypothetical protein
MAMHPTLNRENRVQVSGEVRAGRQPDDERAARVGAGEGLFVTVVSAVSIWPRQGQGAGSNPVGHSHALVAEVGIRVRPRPVCPEGRESSILSERTESGIT